MAIVHNVVYVEPSGYDRGCGYIYGTNICLSFYTNFPKYQLPKYKKAIKTFTGAVMFGIASETYGFDEDNGISFRTYGSFGFYAADFDESIEDFWRHFETVKVYGTQKADPNSKRTEKKMSRYGLRIISEVSKQRCTFSNQSAKKFAMWWMHQ